MRTIIAIAALVSASAFAPAYAFAQDVAAPDAPLPLDEKVKVGTLPNGLRYYIRANEKPENRAELRLAVDVGSVLENEQQLGIAHLTEHMAFNGTREFPKDEIIEFLQRAGMRFGADLNAYTSFDETVYMFTIPTDSAGLLEKGIAILDDFAEGALLEDAEIDKERGVVIEEWRLGQGAGMRMALKQFPVLFKGSRYAERLPIGTKENLETFPVQALKDFYRDWYRPDLMAVVVVGDIDPAEVEAQIRDHFADNKAPANAPERVMYQVPDHPEPLFSIVTDKEATNNQVAVVFLQPADALETHADFRDEMMERLYSQMMNNRLFELTQKEDPPFIGAGAFPGQFVRTKGAFQLGAAVRDGGIERGLDALLTEALRVDRHGFTETELERAKTSVLRSLEVAYAERDKTESASLAGEYVRHFLEDEASPGIAYEFQLAQRFIPTITLEEVNRLARSYITEDNRVILVSGPEKEGVEMPDQQKLLAVFEAVQQKDITAYVDAVSAEPLVATVPQPGTIASESKIPEVGVTEWTLSNGIRVVLKPTDFKADEIRFTAFSPGGTSLVPDDLYDDVQLASTVVAMGGVGSFDAVALQKKLTGKSVSVSPNIGTLEEGFSGTASPQDVETMFQLIHLYATAPRADKTVFDSWSERIEAALANRSASPDAAFQDTIAIVTSQNHPRAQPPSASMIDELDLEDSLEFYRERFADMSDFTFVIVGNFAVDSIKPHVLTWLGSLPGNGRQEQWRDIGIDPPEGVIQKVVRRGVEPRSRTQLVFAGEAEYSEENALALRTLTLILTDRLRERLREELSGAYAPSASGGLSRTPDEEYSVRVGFGSAPDRADELVQAVFDEAAKLKAEGPTEENMLKAKQIQRRELETNMQENAFWAASLANAKRYDMDPRELLEMAKKIDAVTAEMVRQAAINYLRDDRYVRVTLQPENAQAN